MIVVSSSSSRGLWFLPSCPNHILLFLHHYNNFFRLFASLNSPCFFNKVFSFWLLVIWYYCLDFLICLLVAFPPTKPQNPRIFHCWKVIIYVKTSNPILNSFFNLGICWFLIAADLIIWASLSLWTGKLIIRSPLFSL